jgi:hypothetical protein
MAPFGLPIFGQLLASQPESFPESSPAGRPLQPYSAKAAKIPITSLPEDVEEQFPNPGLLK